MGVRVGIDTGGTFTDLVAVDEDSGAGTSPRCPRTRRDPVAAVAAALEQAEFDPADVSFIVVGTTIGINAVLTRTGARVLYLTTEGFEDVPYIQRINRKHHYDFHWRKPEPLVRRRDCLGVAERRRRGGRRPRAARPGGARDASPSGSPPTATAPSRSPSACSSPTSTRITSCAAREVLASAFPTLPVSLSHEIAPIWREYERGTTTTVDAYLEAALRALRGRRLDGARRAGRGRRAGRC